MCDCRCLSKLILVMVNIIFLLAGGAMLAVGVIALVKPGLITQLVSYVPHYDEIPAALNLEGIIGTAGYIMVALGGVVAIVGFFGCCGACCESKCMLIVYAIILVPILAGEAALIIYSIVAPDTLQHAIQDGMYKTISLVQEDVNYTSGSIQLPTNVTSLGWAVLQLEAKCCGTYNYTDYGKWNHSVTYDTYTIWTNIPVSCCKTSRNVDLTAKTVTFDDIQMCLSGNDTYINSENCYDAVNNLIRSSTTIAIGIAAGIIGLQVILFIAACCLCNILGKGTIN